MYLIDDEVFKIRGSHGPDWHNLFSHSVCTIMCIEMHQQWHSYIWIVVLFIVDIIIILMIMNVFIIHVAPSPSPKYPYQCRHQTSSRPANVSEQTPSSSFSVTTAGTLTSRPPSQSALWVRNKPLSLPVQTSVWISHAVCSKTLLCSPHPCSQNFTLWKECSKYSFKL